MKFRNFVAAAMLMIAGGLFINPAMAQDRVFQPGPVITLQLANMEELCSAYNFDDFPTTRMFIRALTLNIRLLPGEDKNELILDCALNLELAGQEGRLPRSLMKLVIGWVQMSCISLKDLEFADQRTCSIVREIRDRNFF